MINRQDEKYKALIGNKEMSKEQEDLCNFAAYGIGNAVVEALAGCGKSKTIEMMCLSINPRKSILITAFNVHIANKLKEELKDYKNISVHTYHSLGFYILRLKYGNDIAFDEYKYKNYVSNNLNELSDGLFANVVGGNRIRYKKNIEKLIDYSRYNKAQSIREIEKCARKYGVELVANECNVVLKVLKWGKSNVKTIDYTDMIWLPYELGIKANLKPVQYDMIFVDEAQDSSPIQQNLIDICKGRSSRFIVVGDENQCINSWAGSDMEAFKHFSEMDNVKKFSLNVSYRCCKKVVDLIKSTYIPDFTSAPNAIDGEVNYNASISKINEGDLVLSRYTSLLVEMYVKLIKAGRIAKIRGLGIGKELNDEIDRYSNNAKTIQDVIANLFQEMFANCNQFVEENKCSMKQALMEKSTMLMYDEILSIIAISEGLTSIEDVKSKINEMFINDDDSIENNRDMITLSTVHRAKGLESDNVFILCPSTMPSSLARRDWEIAAEDNVVYVAWSRAKKSLNFVSEKEFPPHDSFVSNEKLYKEILDYKEKFGI